MCVVYLFCFRVTAALLAVVVAAYNAHVFWTMSLYHDGTSLKCDASDDNYFMMHVFEYLKLISYCVIPFVVVIVLNVCIIVRLRQASPVQCMDTASIASSTNTTPNRRASNRSRRYFFPKTSMPERHTSQNVFDETISVELLTPKDRPSRREMMSVTENATSGPQQSRQRRLTRMLLFVSFVWLVLSAPFALYSLVVNFSDEQQRFAARNLLAKIICFLLVYVNHAINFYLYCLTGSRFRQELCALLSCRSKRTARTYSRRGTAARRQEDERLELNNIVNY